MTDWKIDNPTDRIVATDIAQGIVDLMYRMNASEIRALATQYSRPHDEDGSRCADPDSVYAHLSNGLDALLRNLGVDSESVRDAAFDGTTRLSSLIPVRPGGERK